MQELADSAVVLARRAGNRAAAPDVDEFRQRRRQRELAARLQKLGRRNAEAWQDQSAFVADSRRQKDSGWGEW
jgi:hypothetical protein